MRRARTAAAIAAGLILAAGSVTVASDDPASPAAAPKPPGGSRPPVLSVPPEQAARFSVLRRPADAGDVLPYHAQRVIRLGAGPQFGANPALARRAAAHAGPDVFLVPADGHLCIVTGDGGASCNRVDAALDGYLLITQSKGSGAARVHAALPDGVRRATVGTDSGEAVADAEGNVVTVDTQGPLRELRFEDAAGGAHRVPLWSPPDQ